MLDALKKKKKLKKKRQQQQQQQGTRLEHSFFHSLAHFLFLKEIVKMSTPNSISLIVKYGSESFQINAQISTVGQLLEVIEERTGVVKARQKLLFKGKQLTNLPLSTTLTNCGVGPGAKLMLLSVGSGATAAHQLQSQGAVALRASQREKSEALKKKQEENKSKSTATAAAEKSSTVIAAKRVDAWKKLGIASLRDLKLTELPEELFTQDCADCIRVADLGGNQLTSLPPSLSTLSHLQKLRLSLNALHDTGMPWTSFSSLANLIVLAVDHNCLTTLPEQPFYHLKNLQKLDVSYNKISVLPTSLSCLVSLRAFNVSHNELLSLPMQMAACVVLEEVDASHNCITDIPPEFGALLKLKTLILDRNR